MLALDKTKTNKLSKYNEKHPNIEDYMLKKLVNKFEDTENVQVQNLSNVNELFMDLLHKIIKNERSEPSKNDDIFSSECVFDYIYAKFDSLIDLAEEKIDYYRLDQLYYGLLEIANNRGFEVDLFDYYVMMNKYMD